MITCSSGSPPLWGGVDPTAILISCSSVQGAYAIHAACTSPLTASVCALACLLACTQYHLVFEPCMKGDLYQMMTKQTGGVLQESFVALQVTGGRLAAPACDEQR